jgi:hypothetical protein
MTAIRKHPKTGAAAARCALIAATEDQPTTLAGLLTKASLLRLFCADGDVFAPPLGAEARRFLYSLAGDAEAIADRAGATS